MLRRQYGLRISRAKRWIDAVLVDAPTLELLEIDSSEPLLRIDSIASCRPLEHEPGLHRCRSSPFHAKTTT